MAFIGTLRGVTLSRRGKQWGRLKEGRSEAFLFYFTIHGMVQLHTISLSI